MRKGPTRYKAHNDASVFARRNDQIVAVLDEGGGMFLITFPDGYKIWALEEEVIDTGPRTATTTRLALPPHPTARHGFGKPAGVTDEEYYDEMPMWEDGDIGDPTGAPRHRAKD